MQSEIKKKARVRNGRGRLYKRTRDGKEYPANSKVRGTFWFCYYTDGHRVRQKLLHEDGSPITKLRDAEQVQQEILAPLVVNSRKKQLRSIQNQLQDIDASKSTSLSVPSLQLSKVWWAYCRSHNRPASGERTLKGYQSQLEAFIEWVNKTHPKITEMRDVSTQHAEEYADVLGLRRLSPSTYNQHLNTLSLVWAVLTTKGRITHNPFAWEKKTRTGIHRKSVKAESCLRKKRALTIEEINTLIDHTTGDFKTLIIILACTGQRLVDGVKLQWKSIDYEKKLITLIPQKTASRTGVQVFIPMLPQLVSELKDRRKKSDYVLPELVELYNRDAGATLSKRMRKVFTKAGLPAAKNLNLKHKNVIVETGAHSLRHTFVTIARLAGFPDPLICQITGHTSQEMVDHYTQFSEKLVASLAAQIPCAGKGKIIIESIPQKQVPKWVVEKLNTMTEKNWKQIRQELLSEEMTTIHAED